MPILNQNKKLKNQSLMDKSGKTGSALATTEKGSIKIELPQPQLVGDGLYWLPVLDAWGIKISKDLDADDERIQATLTRIEDATLQYSKKDEQCIDEMFPVMKFTTSGQVVYDLIREKRFEYPKPGVFDNAVYVNVYNVLGQTMTPQAWVEFHMEIKSAEQLNLSAFKMM